MKKYNFKLIQLKIAITKLFFILIIFTWQSATADILNGKVVKITDGDTVHILDSEHKIEKVRLAFIDTPESKQAYGNLAKQHLRDLIGNQYVTVQYSKRDQYKRILGTIFFNDEDINLRMIKAGLAWHYKQYTRDQSIKDRYIYSMSETYASSNQIGLFSDKNAIPPWEWRKNKRLEFKAKKQRGH